MNTEISGVVLQLALLIALSYPLGRYIAKVYKGVRILLRKSLFGHKINALTIIMLHSCDEKYHLVTII